MNTHTRRVLILKQRQSIAQSGGKLLTSRFRFIIFKPHGSLRTSPLFRECPKKSRSLAHSLSWLACAFSPAAYLRVPSRGLLVRSPSWLACAFFLATRLPVLSRGLLVCSLSWLASAFSLAARLPVLSRGSHANRLLVFRSTQQAPIVETMLKHWIALTPYTSLSSGKALGKLIASVIHLAPVVQKMDSAIHWINLYPSLDSDLSVVQMVNSAIQLLRNWGLIDIYPVDRFIYLSNNWAQSSTPSGYWGIDTLEIVTVLLVFLVPRQLPVKNENKMHGYCW